MKKLFLLSLILGLAIGAFGCGSSGGSIAGSTDTFSNPDCLKATIGSLEGIMNVNSIAQPTPLSLFAKKGLSGDFIGPETVSAICDLDGTPYTITFYYRTTAGETSVLSEFYATSSPDHGGFLGSASNPCSMSMTTSGEGAYNVSYNANGISPALHPPVQDFTMTYGGPITASEETGVSINLTGSFTIKNHASGVTICTGTIALTGSITESGGSIRFVLTVTDTTGGQIELIVAPGDTSISGHLVNGLPAIGKITVSGVSGYGGPYYFNAEGDYDPTPPW